MYVLGEIKKRALQVAGPIFGISLACYFGYHLVQGDRGLLASQRLNQRIAETKAVLAEVEAERKALESKVAYLRPEHIDRDLLDERSRATLNLAGPNEVVILYPGAVR